MIKVFSKIVSRLVKIYWFIFRPITQGVKVIIFYQGKILVVRQTYSPLTWTFPGGGVKKNESNLAAVKRECLEEVGIELLNPGYVGELHFDTEYKKDTVSMYREDATSDFIGKIQRLEIVEAGWFNLDDLPNMGKNGRAMLDCVLNSEKK